MIRNEKLEKNFFCFFIPLLQNNSSIYFLKSALRMSTVLRGGVVGENSIFVCSSEGVEVGRRSENDTFLEPSVINYKRDHGVPLSSHQHSI